MSVLALLGVLVLALPVMAIGCVLLAFALLHSIRLVFVVVGGLCVVAAEGCRVVGVRVPRVLDHRTSEERHTDETFTAMMATYHQA